MRIVRTGTAAGMLGGLLGSLLLVSGCGFDLDGEDAPRLGQPASATREGKSPAAPPSTRAPADNVYDERYEMHGNPTPEEQLILELINRARLDPDAEAVRLNILPDIHEGVPAPSPIEPLHPLAMNGRLLAAARLHCWDMNDRGFFDHYMSPPPYPPLAWLEYLPPPPPPDPPLTPNPDYDPAAPKLSPGDRIDAQGYPWNTWGENIAYGYAAPELHHSAYIIDTGIVGRGHRVNCLGNPNFVEVGVGYIDPGDGAANEYSTEDFGARPGYGAFVVGVVYDDMDGDGFYDIDEGVADVTVMPDSGDWHAITSDSGGYAIPITMSGAVTITFTFPGGYGATKTINVDNPLERKLDCTVQESDAYGYLEFSSATFSHGEGGGSATITVSRTGGSFEAVGVTYQTSAGGSATAGGDYTAVTNTLAWADGDPADKTFTVPILDDNNDEPNETVFLALSSPTGGVALGGQSTATLTIVDDDVAGALEITTSPLTVGEDGGQITITVERTGGSDGDIEVTYATSDGSAVAGSDYTTTGGTLSWGHGVTTPWTFNVPILDLDTTPEADETFSVILSAPTNGAVLGVPSTVAVTITDDDQPGTISLVAVSYTVDEDVGVGTITLQVTRTGGWRGVATVEWSTAAGTAASPADFTAVAGGTVQWNDGEDGPKDITVTIQDDADLEIDEEFTVTLANAVVASLGAPITATVTILDDEIDSAAPAVTVAEPLDGETVSGVVTVAGSASDNLAVASVEISVDGGPYVTVPGVPLADSVDWSYALPTWGLPNGDHDITVLVTDYRGSTDQVTVTVTVRNEIGILGANGVGGCVPGAGAGAGVGTLFAAFALLAGLLRRRR